MKKHGTPRAGKQSRAHRFSILLSDDERARLAQLAERECMSAADVIRRWIRAGARA